MKAAAAHVKAAAAHVKAAAATTTAKAAFGHRRDVRYEAERTHRNASRNNCYRSLHGRFSSHGAWAATAARHCLNLFMHQLLSPMAGF